MRARFGFACVGFLGLVAVAASVTRVSPSAVAQAPKKTAAKDAVATTIGPFLAKHCLACHGPDKRKGDLVLHTYPDEASILKGRKVWTRVITMLHAGEMPPESRPKPPTADASKFIAAVQEIFDRYDRTAPRDPGRVTMRRLNRAEYANTIRDLMGVDFPVGEDFPNDDVGHGFDNIGDVLTISPLHMERYLAAAETIVKQAIVVGDAPKPTVRTMAGRFLEPAIIPVGKARPLYTKGPLHTPFTINNGGEVKIVVRITPELYGDEPPKFAILLDGKELKRFEAKEKGFFAKSYEVTLNLSKGTYRPGVSLLNEARDPKREKKRRGILVESIQFIGPMDTRPDSHRMLLAAPDKLDGAAKTRHVMSRFLDRAYRRPATADELARVMKVADRAAKAGEPWEGQVALAMQAVLVSPKFLFRAELDHRPTEKAMHPIDDYQLASRLSYFLWSTMPDAELVALASKKQLHANLDAQVKRMLKDDRAKSLVDNFAMQWLQLRVLKNSSPDPKLFPEFDDKLRAFMVEETKRFFWAVIQEDRSILDLIDGKFTYLNEPLARHYGIRDTNGNPFFDKAVTKAGEVIRGEKFVRVDLTPTIRGGILTQASVLTVNSNPTRTSPVKRGRWVLEQLLGTPPPPPPPNVPELDSAEGKQTKGTLRQRMEQHRANPACAGCHASMDQIGFAFENFNAVGKFRKSDGEATIDPSGKLPGGQTFQGAPELQKILRGKSELFSRCLTEKMVTYAVGRGVESYDKRAIDAIVASLPKTNHRFSALVTAVVQSDPFRMRRGKDQP